MKPQFVNKRSCKSRMVAADASELFRNYVISRNFIHQSVGSRVSHHEIEGVQHTFCDLHIIKASRHRKPGHAHGMDGSNILSPYIPRVIACKNADIKRMLQKWNPPLFVRADVDPGTGVHI
jgi:hypothetical protein